MSAYNTQSDYPNIFNPANCSLISQLLPAGPKNFLNDFMEGNAFRNPIAQAANLLRDKMGVNLNKLDILKDLGGPNGLNVQLNRMNARLTALNDQMSSFIIHTNRLSGLTTDSILPRLDQIIGVMSAYNSMKDLLKNPGDLLEDNFSNAFSSLNPQLVGPFFENFGQNMNNISAVLNEIEFQLREGGVTDLADTINQLRQLTDNLNALNNNLQAFKNNDNNAFALALTAVEKFALGNSIISTSLTDPCFGAQLLKNLILKPEFSSGLDGIAKDNGVQIEGSPVNLLDHIPSLR